MKKFETVQKNLEKRGFSVKAFATGEEAAAYLNREIDGVSVGFGGSVTLDSLGLYESLGAHNEVIWHWKLGMEMRSAAGSMNERQLKRTALSRAAASGS